MRQLPRRDVSARGDAPRSRAATAPVAEPTRHRARGPPASSSNERGGVVNTLAAWSTTETLQEGRTSLALAGTRFHTSRAASLRAKRVSGAATQRDACSVQPWARARRTARARTGRCSPRGQARAARAASPQMPGCPPAQSASRPRQRLPKKLSRCAACRRAHIKLRRVAQRRQLLECAAGERAAERRRSSHHAFGRSVCRLSGGLGGEDRRSFDATRGRGVSGIRARVARSNNTYGALSGRPWQCRRPRRRARRRLRPR